MKLTDKCKEDFLAWLQKERNEEIVDGKTAYDLYYLFSYVFPEQLKNILIIQFFDSVGMTIEITVDINNNANSCDENCENCDSCYDTWNPEFEYCIYVFTEIINNLNDYSMHCSDDNFETRIIAADSAIAKANEIYNSKEK